MPAYWPYLYINREETLTIIVACLDKPTVKVSISTINTIRSNEALIKDCVVYNGIVVECARDYIWAYFLIKACL